MLTLKKKYFIYPTWRNYWAFLTVTYKEQTGFIIWTQINREEQEEVGCPQTGALSIFSVPPGISPASRTQTHICSNCAGWLYCYQSFYCRFCCIYAHGQNGSTGLQCCFPENSNGLMMGCWDIVGLDSKCSASKIEFHNTQLLMKYNFIYELWKCSICKQINVFHTVLSSNWYST